MIDITLLVNDLQQFMIGKPIDDLFDLIIPYLADDLPKETGPLELTAVSR